jgi:hypothetical protein
MLPPIPHYPYDLNITVQSESEERQIHDLVELLLDRRRLEAMIEYQFSLYGSDGWFGVTPWDYWPRPHGSTPREAIDVALEILRDRQRQTASAEPKPAGGKEKSAT